MTSVVMCSQNLSVPQDTRVWREARALAEAGYDVTCVCPRTHGGPKVENIDGVQICRYAIPSFPGMAGFPSVVGQAAETMAALFHTAVFAARRLLGRNRIDVLHAANPPDSYYVIARMLRPFGTRFVFDQHDLVPELAGARGTKARAVSMRLFRKMESASYKAADMVITPNNSYRRTAIERGGLDPANVITVRSGPDAVTDSSVDERSENTIFFAGVINQQDTVEVLVRAAGVLATRRRDFRLRLVGKGDDIPRLQTITRETSIEDLVDWVDWVDQPTLAIELSRATVAVSPDANNAFNRLSTMTKIAEYLAAGVPSVVADLPENRYTAAEAVEYYRADDSDSLAAKLDALLNDDSRRSQLSAAARRRAALLTWNHSKERLVAAYRMLVDGVDGPIGDQVVETTPVETAPFVVDLAARPQVDLSATDERSSA